MTVVKEMKMIEKTTYILDFGFKTSDFQSAEFEEARSSKVLSLTKHDFYLFPFVFCLFNTSN
jgi:hypothetical protein